MSQMSEAMAAALRKKPTSFEQSATERAKLHPEYAASPSTEKPKFVPRKGGIIKVDKALYDAGVADEQPK